MYRQLVGILLMLMTSLAFAVPVCTVSTSEASFGIYDETTGSPLDSTAGSVSVSCSDNALSSPRSMYYEVKLGAGTSGNYAPRTMFNSAFGLAYYLYRSPAFNAANVWGDGSTGASLPLGSCITVLAGGSPSSANVHLVNGRMSGSQSPVSVGRYSDVLPVTLVLYGDCASGTAAQSTIFAAPSLSVSAEVLARCVIATGPYILEFGDYARGGGPKSANTNIGVTCPANTSYSIGLGGLEDGIRKLVNGTNSLEYNLYSNSNHSNVVGNTERVNTIDGLGTGSRVNTTIYGLLPDSPANQAAPPGLYQATVVITVYY